MGDSISNNNLQQLPFNPYTQTNTQQQQPNILGVDNGGDAGEVDAYHAGGSGAAQLFPNQVKKPHSAGGGGGADATQDTAVTGQGSAEEVAQQLVQEYGPVGAMMMVMCSMFSGASASSGANGQNNAGGTSVGDTQAEKSDNVNDPNAQPELMQAQGQGGGLQATMGDSSGTISNAQDIAGGDTGGVSYQQVNGTLWGDTQAAPQGINSTVASMQQSGDVGDCYFASSLAGVAAGNPDAVKNMIRPDPNGNPNDYQVRFYSKDPQTGQMQPEWVSVNNDLPTDGQGNGGGMGLPKDSSGQPIIGPALIEKAWAKFNDEHQITQQEGVQGAGAGYNGIGSGGLGPEAMQAITGQQVNDVGDPSSPDSLQQQHVDDGDLTNALNQANPPNHAPTIAGSTNNPSDGVMPGHAYTVLGTYQQNGQTMVSLRNPWGTNDANNPNDPKGGVMSLSLAQFKKDFGAVSTTGAAGTPDQSQNGGGAGGGTQSSMAAFNLRNQNLRA